MRCRSCGTLNSDEAAVCTACGTALHTPTQLVHPTPQATRVAPPGSLAAPPVVDVTAKTQISRSTGGRPVEAGGGGGVDPDATVDGSDDDEARLQPGDKVLSHYVIVRQLGRGGMGTVYLGFDDVSSQQVAIKVLPGVLARERGIRERFVQEARALASLDHPGIVPLITFAQEGEDRFLVMKYVNGRSLESLINGDTALPVAEVRRILKEVVLALDYAHKKGVVHRDIKPANVLVDDTGRVVVVDFGIARKLEGEKRLTQTGMLMGTPQYMSPEQIEGFVVDGRADLYACGLMLFEMLTGRPPFDEGKTFDVLRAHVEKPVPDLHPLRAAFLGHKTHDGRDAVVDDDLVALCAALLQKEPDLRPASGRAVAAMLDGTSSIPVTLPPAPAASTPASATSTVTSTAVTSTGATTTPALPVRRATTETPALAFSDAGPLDDDEPIAAPSNPALRWAAALLVLTVGVVVGVRVFGNPLAGLGDADTVVDAGVAGDPFEMGVLLSRARVAFEKGKFDDARVAVDTALHLDKDNVEALLLRAQILVAAQNPTGAQQTLARLPATLPAEQERERADIAGLIEALLAPPDDAGVADDDKPARTPKRDKKPDDKKPDDKKPDDKKPDDKKAEAPARPRPSQLDDKTLGTITSSTRAALSACYENHVLAVDPKAAGEVILAVVVAADGSVSSVRLKKDPFRMGDFAECLGAAVKVWKFPAFDGEPDTYTHTLRFKAG